MLDTLGKLCDTLYMKTNLMFTNQEYLTRMPDIVLFGPKQAQAIHQLDISMPPDDFQNAIADILAVPEWELS
jgi:hypothetical protein